MIEDANDLGTVPDLLNQPQKYADFLGPEIRFVYKGDLLVVMPDGLGVAATDATPTPARAIEGMQVEAGGTPDGLAQTAEEAVAKLSAAAGHPLDQAKKGGSGGGGGAGAGAQSSRWSPRRFWSSSASRARSGCAAARVRGRPSRRNPHRALRTPSNRAPVT